MRRQKNAFVCECCSAHSLAHTKAKNVDSVWELQPTHIVAHTMLVLCAGAYHRISPHRLSHIRIFMLFLYLSRRIAGRIPKNKLFMVLDKIDGVLVVLSETDTIV